MLLMDTSLYPAEDRAELIRDGLSDLAGVNVAPAHGDALMQVRWRAWEMGDDCSLLSMQSTGVQLRRPPARFSSAESVIIGFCAMPSGVCRFSQSDRHEIVPDGGMFIAEMSEAFTCQLPAGTEGANLMIPLDVLDIPLRDVRKAAQWLPRSPLYGLACQHLLSLTQYTKEFDVPHPSAQQAALHMLRALVKSFGAD
ncbi:MAG TPA: hypothetical protein VF070_06915 [Streptosporangiaceae bacterium]